MRANEQARRAWPTGHTTSLLKTAAAAGHAYAKALRTVKSCVGSTWCRYGLQDSVGFAVRVEERYRGVRAPHKLKSAVSGCVRECAEAQCKDFGLIATEAGYNLYVCGNGGAKPAHGKLLAVDKSEDEIIKIVDRFLMFYIRTAGPLIRTARWLEEMEGGFDYLKAVIMDDKLGINDSLEKEMEQLVKSYKCEWTEVVKNPEVRKRFTQFVNEPDVKEQGIEFIDVRGQRRPADWPKQVAAKPDDLAEALKTLPAALQTAAQMNGAIPNLQDPADSTEQVAWNKQRISIAWVRLASVADVPRNSGSAVLYGKVQLAIFNFAARGEWYATSAMCPHKNAFVMNQGLLGDSAGVPKVACPMHKKNFALTSGECMTGEVLQLPVFPVKVEGDDVYVLLPPQKELDDVLATELYKICATSSNGGCGGCSTAPDTTKDGGKPLTAV